MAAKLIAHCNAVKNFLQTVGFTSEAANLARSAQRESLVALIKQTSMSFDDATSLQTVLQGMQWEDADMQSLNAALLSSMPLGNSSGAALANSRRQMQDFTGVLNYFTAALWECFCDAGVDGGSKMQKMLTHCINLGMACPSETTMQHLAGVYINACEQQAIGPAMRLEIVKAMKSNHRRLMGKMTLPGGWVQKLPTDPQIFRTQHPDWYERAFKHAPPVSSLIPVENLQAQLVSIPMRSSRLDVKVPSMARSMSSQQLSLMPPAPQQPQSQMLEAFAQTMLQTMQQMAQMQQMTLQQISQLTQGRPSERRLEFSAAAIPAARQLALPAALPAALPPALPSALPAAHLALPDEKFSTPMQRVRMSDCEASNQSKKPKQSVQDVAELVRQAVGQRKIKSTSEQEEDDLAKEEAVGQSHQVLAKAKSKSACKQKQKKAADHVKSKPPTIAWEKTRSQVMCRTGRAGAGQCHAIKYGTGVCSEKQAWAKAEKWLKQERKDRGI